MEIKPILFSTPMVQAIMDGRKSMTRRVVNPQPRRENSYYGGEVTHADDKSLIGCVGFCRSPLAVCDFDYARPRYIAGDILWVRETWAPATQNRIVYRADYGSDKDMIPYEVCGMNVEVSLVRWKPSIFMPKEACRLFLRVTDVRAERLQEMTENDADAEGFDWKCPSEHRVYGDGGVLVGMCWSEGECNKAVCDCDISIPELFGKYLWDSLNAKRGYPWASNPFVWVYSFERCEKPEGWC